MEKTISKLHPALQDYFARLSSENPSPERKALLDSGISYARKCRSASEPLLLQFICTHNSRRSQLAQAWASAAAAQLEIPATCYSGGTEATAVHPSVLQVLQEAGFAWKPAEDALLYYGPNLAPLSFFSKKIDHPTNPRRDFLALLTCEEAAEACPVVPGAAARINLPYPDPKEADGLPHELQRYRERSRQIAREMLYFFQQI